MKHFKHNIGGCLQKPIKQWFAVFLVFVMHIWASNAAAQVYKIEAEDGTPGSKEVSKLDNDEHSNGAYVGNIGGGVDRTVTYIFNAPRAGAYSMNICYMTWEARKMYVQVNGGNQTLEDENYPATGGWEGAGNLGYKTITINLNAGDNTLVLGNADGSAPNVDYFELTAPQAPVSTQWGNLFSTDAAPVWNIIQFVNINGGNAFLRRTNIEPGGYGNVFTWNEDNYDRNLWQFIGNEDSFIIKNKQNGRYGQYNGTRFTLVENQAAATYFRLSQYADGKTVIQMVGDPLKVLNTDNTTPNDGGNQANINDNGFAADNAAVEIFPDISNVVADLGQQQWIRFNQRGYVEYNYITDVNGNALTSTNTLSNTTRWTVVRQANGRFQLKNVGSNNTLTCTEDFADQGTKNFSTIGAPNAAQSNLVLYRNANGNYTMRLADSPQPTMAVNANQTPGPGGNAATNQQVVYFNNLAGDVGNWLEFIPYNNQLLPELNVPYAIGTTNGQNLLYLNGNAPATSATRTLDDVPQMTKAVVAKGSEDVQQTEVWKLVPASEVDGQEGVFRLLNGNGLYLTYANGNYTTTDTEANATRFVIYPTTDGTLALKRYEYAAAAGPYDQVAFAPATYGSFPYQLRFTNTNAANLNGVYINDQGADSNVRLQNGNEMKSLWDIEFTGDRHNLDFRLKSAYGNYLTGPTTAGQQANGRYSTTTNAADATLFRFQQRDDGGVSIARKSSEATAPDGYGIYNVYSLNPPGSVTSGNEVSEWNPGDNGNNLEVVALNPQPDTQYRIRFTDGVTTNGGMVSNNHLNDNGAGVNVTLTDNSKAIVRLNWRLTAVDNGTYRLQSALGNYLYYDGTAFISHAVNATVFTLVGDDNANFQLSFQNGGNTYYLSKNGNNLAANAAVNAAANYVLFLYEPWQHTTRHAANKVTHRANYLFDKASEVNSNGEWPDGFLKGEGDGMWVNGDTRIQQTSTYEITRYVPAGQSVTLLLPPVMGDRLTDRAYQRWYDYGTESSLPSGVLDLGKTIWGYQFQNGFVTGTNVLYYSESAEDVNGLQKGRMTENSRFYANSWGEANIKATLPTGSPGVDVALDMSRYSDWTLEDNGDLVEPSLTMRAIWHILPSTVIADKLQTAKTNNDADATKQNAWLEGIKTIHFPKSGLYRDDRLPLELDLNNYYFPDGSNAGRADGYHIVLEDNGTGITLGGENGLYIYRSGNNYYYARSRFIDFVYPGADKTVTATGEGNAATIEFYGVAENGTNYPIVKYIIIFDEGSNTNYYATWDALNNDGRSPQALQTMAGDPIASITFDTPSGADNYTTPTSDNGGTITPYKDYPDKNIYGHKQAGYTDTEFQSSLLPLDFAQSSYAFDMGNCDWGHYSLMGEYKPGTEVLLSPVGKSGTATANYSIIKEGMSPHLFWVDASECPGNVSRVYFDGTFCSGSKLMCTGWMACDNSQNDGSREPGSIILKIRGLRGGETVDLHAFCPGQVSREGRNPDRSATAVNGYVWQQFYFEFTIDQLCENYWLDIENNCVSTDGGDYILDNIDVYAIVPTSEIRMQTPLCINTDETGELKLLQVVSPFAGLLASVGKTRASDSDNSTDNKITFAYLHKEKFLDKYAEELKSRLGDSGYATLLDGRTLEEAIDVGILDFEGYAEDSNKEKRYQAYKVAFDYALVGTKTNNAATSVWKSSDPTANIGAAFVEFTWPTYYDGVKEFTLAQALDDTNKANGDPEKNYIYRTTTGQEAFVFNGQVSGVQWPEYGDYYLLTYNNAVSNLNDIYNDFNMCSPCMNLIEFSINSSLRVLGVETAESKHAETYCEGKFPTIRTDIQVFDTSGASINLDGVHFDWWVGRNDDPSTYAKLSNYWERDNGLTGDERITLTEALFYFRTSYPEKADFKGVNPTASLTQGMIDFLKRLVDTGELYLYKIAIDEMQIKAQETVNGTNYYYMVACPITVDVSNKINKMNSSKGTSYAIWCNAPQGLAIIVQGLAPSVKSGYDKDNETIYDYHEADGETKLLSIRLGKRSQFDVLRHGDEYSPPSHSTTEPNIFLPLRAANAPNTNCIMENADDRNIYLSTTDDPTWDAAIRTTQLAGSLPIVGKIVNLYALDGNDTDMNLNEQNYLQMHFTEGFNAREGFNYRLKIPYKEGPEGNNSCEGDLLIDLKIVPDYQVWTGAAGNNDWNNDLNWRRADQTDLRLAAGNLEPKSATGMSIAAPTLKAVEYPANDSTLVANNNGVGFAPLEVTNILMITGESATTVDAPNLYDVTPTGNNGDNFPNLNAATSTGILKYDFIARDWEYNAENQENLDKHNGMVGDLVAIMYKANICRQIAFQPQTEMLNAHLLNYEKAWVEYELRKNRWHLLGSPLKNMVSGDWYAPSTAEARQLTTYFEDITFDANKHDRYAPAIFQRNWDQANAILYEVTSTFDANANTDALNDAAVPAGNTTSADTYLARVGYKVIDGKKANVAIKGSWSSVYNDASVRYDQGGFSTLIRNNLKNNQNGHYTDDDTQKALVRLPKEDATFDIYTYNQDGSGTETTAPAERHKLRTDDMADGTNLTVTLKNTGGAKLGYFLVGNPFICGLDMDKFFAQNTGLNKNYRMLTDSGEQQTIAYNATSGKWELDGTTVNPVVEPGQGFFVSTTAAAEPDSLTLTFTTAMMTAAYPLPDPNSDPAPARMLITAERDHRRSTAIIQVNDEAHNEFQENEDVETFIDENVMDIPTVYTLCGQLATVINSIRDFRVLPIGVESNSNNVCTLTFSGVEALGDSIAVYDAVTRQLTPIASGSTMRVAGRTQNRYYIVDNHLQQQEIAHETHLRIGFTGRTISVVASTQQPITQVRCYDAAGHLIHNASPQEAEYRFTLPDSGIYIIEATTNGDSKTQKFIIR